MNFSMVAFNRSTLNSQKEEELTPQQWREIIHKVHLESDEFDP